MRFKYFSIDMRQIPRMMHKPPERTARRKKYPIDKDPVPSSRMFIPKNDVVKLNGINTNATTESLRLLSIKIEL
jgi:hypothetical protein